MPGSATARDLLTPATPAPTTPAPGATRASRAALTALLVALLVLLLAEAATVPFAIYTARPLLILEVLGLAFAEAPLYLWPGLACLLGAALLYRLELGPRTAAVLYLLLSAMVTGEVMALLFRYRPFRAYIPFYVLLGGLFALTALALRPPPTTPRRGLWAWLLDRSVLYVALPAAIAVYVYAYVANRGLYANLHLASLQIAHHLLGLGLLRLLLLARPPPLRRRALLVTASTVAALILGGAVAKGTGALRGGLPYFRAFSVLGQSHVVFKPFRSEDEGEPEEPRTPEEPLAVFAEHSAMPVLPDDFDLGDYNVLLVASEATRYDQTSLFDPSLGTTPTLERLAEDAFVFSRAYAPSSGTVHSMSGLLAMSYPSMLKLESWSKAWHGRLHDDEPILSEHFRDAGYQTFWVGHNYESVFDIKILGLDRGWDQIKLHTSATKTAANDSKVGESALKALKEVAADERPFFGWIFFESPHGRYHAHYPDMPGETKLERYRQEIRFMDEQLGRVLDDLERRELLDTTIILFVSDHGEEFREHGGTRHKSTVYSESTRVPLLIRIPGVEGRVIDRPTSTLYAPAWLLLHGAEVLREAAEAQIRRVFAPMMAETEGGVAIELCGHDRMISSLVYPEYKFNYDFIAGRYEAFRILDDPLEQEDLFGRDPELTALAIRQLRRYRKVRRDRRRYILLPDYEIPPEAKAEAEARAQAEAEAEAQAEARAEAQAEAQARAEARAKARARAKAKAKTKAKNREPAAGKEAAPKPIHTLSEPATLDLDPSPAAPPR